MLFHVAFILVFLVSLATIAAVMRRIEADVTEFQRESRKVEETHQRLDVACNTLKAMMAQVDGEVSRAQGELVKALEAKEAADLQLAAVLDTPKQRLHVFDKATLVHGKLWEVTVVNEGFPADKGGGAQEWAAGRVCVVGGAMDRDARYRTESRFPQAQGYRIIKVERFRRA